MARPLLDALSQVHDAGDEPDLSSCSCWRARAAMFSTSIKEKFLELLPNRVITDSIGSSETGFGGTRIVAKGESHTGGPRVDDRPPHRRARRRRQRGQAWLGSARAHREEGNIPVGYYKDEKKTAETFKTFNGVRYAIPGDYAEVEADGTVTMLGRGSESHQHRRREDLPRRGRGRAQGPPRRVRRAGRRRPRRAIGQRVAAVVQPPRRDGPDAG